MEILKKIEDKLEEVLDISKDSSEESSENQKVVSTKIHNIKYVLDEATIYNEVSYAAVTEAYVNDSKKAVDAKLKLPYKGTCTNAWNSLSSKPAGPVVVKAEVPVVRNGRVKVFGSLEGDYEWAKTNTLSNQIDFIYQVKVPPLKKVTVNLVVATAECDVPFSYTQTNILEDKHEKNNDLKDGLYHGIMDSFSFNYETKEEDI